MEIERSVIALHESVNEMRKAKEQVKKHADLLENYENMDDLKKMGKSLQEKITKWEDNLIQSKQKTFQDVINFPNQLNAELLNLKSRVDTHDPIPTKGATQRLNDLQKQWNAHKDALQQIITTDVKEFNDLYKSKNLPAIIMKPKPMVSESGDR